MRGPSGACQAESSPISTPAASIAAIVESMGSSSFGTFWPVQRRSESNISFRKNRRVGCCIHRSMVIATRRYCSHVVETFAAKVKGIDEPLRAVRFARARDRMQRPIKERACTAAANKSIARARSAPRGRLSAHNGLSGRAAPSRANRGERHQPYGRTDEYLLPNRRLHGGTAAAGRVFLGRRSRLIARQGSDNAAGIRTCARVVDWAQRLAPFLRDIVDVRSLALIRLRLENEIGYEGRAYDVRSETRDAGEWSCDAREERAEVVIAHLIRCLAGTTIGARVRA
jgi:hypothetical protein